jgi:hypothetical protein
MRLDSGSRFESLSPHSSVGHGREGRGPTRGKPDSETGGGRQADRPGSGIGEGGWVGDGRRPPNRRPGRTDRRCWVIGSGWADRAVNIGMLTSR